MAVTVTNTLTFKNKDEMTAQTNMYLSRGFRLTMQTEKSVTLTKEEQMDYVIVAVLIFACFVPGIVYYLVKKDKLKNELVTLTLE